MRGTPFLQAILIVVMFLVAGIPMYRLTRSAEATASTSGPTPSAVDDHSPANSATLDVEVVFAPANGDFEIKNLGQTVLSGHEPQARFTGRWTAAVPPEGVDLVIHARWPSAGSLNGAPPIKASPRAMRVTVRFPGGRTVEKTFWTGDGDELDDVFTVPGETPVAATP